MRFESLKKDREAMTVRDAIEGRVAVRRFVPGRVPREVVRDILRTASHAPSGANIQPWKVYVVTGSAKAALSARIQLAYAQQADEHAEEYQYYPDASLEPYASRKKQFGKLFYGALGILQDDDAGRARQTARNFEFFDAAVGMIFTIDRRLGQGSWLDYGMFLQNIMLAARAWGLETCPQVSIARFHKVLRECLAIPDGELVVCGMSLGYADAAAPELSVRQPRLAVDAFASFEGFDPEPA
ncbi:nitroreductase [Cupriavidus necator]|uniref:nitroreductase n=1 Tax=Cupriavidus necator TaxID=106590 RepID=UPI000AE8EF51|nr:nitroreductase [Cupriavidus necator]